LITYHFEYKCTKFVIRIKVFGDVNSFCGYTTSQTIKKNEEKCVRKKNYQTKH